MVATNRSILGGLVVYFLFIWALNAEEKHKALEANAFTKTAGAQIVESKS